MVGLTITWEARLEPPTFARTGGVRWMIQNTAMNGVHACEMLVRYGRAAWRRFMIAIYLLT